MSKESWKKVSLCELVGGGLGWFCIALNCNGLTFWLILGRKIGQKNHKLFENCFYTSFKSVLKKYIEWIK
jgi:hypothetical protein